MPYIKPRDRETLDVFPPVRSPNTAGELNYLITKALIEEQLLPNFSRTIQRVFGQYLTHKGISYQTVNDIVGASLCASREFNRRTGKEALFSEPLIHLAVYFYDAVGAPYEDKKIRDNGDVYPKELLNVSRDDKEQVGTRDAGDTDTSREGAVHDNTSAGS